MKRLLLIALFLIVSVSIATSDQYVNGYTRHNKDGSSTYVQPYYRTSPNETKTDNYSYPGNYNPNTGRVTPGNGYNTGNGYNNDAEKRSDYGNTKNYSESNNWDPYGNGKKKVPEKRQKGLYED